MSQIDDQVFVYNDSGIYMLQGAQPVALPHTHTMSSKDQALVVLPYKEQQVLIVTERKGIFLYSIEPKHSDDAININHMKESADQNLQVLKTPVSKYLKQHVFTRGLRLANGNYAFGTRQGGIVLMRPDGQPLMVIDKNKQVFWKDPTRFGYGPETYTNISVRKPAMLLGSYHHGIGHYGPTRAI